MGIDTSNIPPMTFGQIAFICGLTLEQVHAYVAIGKLKAFRFHHNQWRVEFDDFANFRSWLADEDERVLESSSHHSIEPGANEQFSDRTLNANNDTKAEFRAAERRL